MHDLVKRLLIWSGSEPPAPPNVLLREDCAEAARLIRISADALAKIESGFVGEVDSKDLFSVLLRTQAVATEALNALAAGTRTKALPDPPQVSKDG